MAIKILLSKEQYAALQFCGCELSRIAVNKDNGEMKSPLSLSKVLPLDLQKNDKMQNNNL